MCTCVPQNVERISNLPPPIFNGKPGWLQWLGKQCPWIDKLKHHNTPPTHACLQGVQTLYPLFADNPTANRHAAKASSHGRISPAAHSNASQRSHGQAQSPAAPWPSSPPSRWAPRRHEEEEAPVHQEPDPEPAAPSAEARGGRRRNAGMLRGGGVLGGVCGARVGRGWMEAD